jgi:two-component system sensor histidine kinase ChiS
MPDAAEAPLFLEDDTLLFADEATAEVLTAGEAGFASPDNGNWKIMIVDDEAEIHQVTQLALADFRFEDKGVNFISAYSGREAGQLLQAHPDVALILLDVVMETDDAGLALARHIRRDLNNQSVRIVLRTGQPGQAPEGTVVVDYDINDYKAKTELTTQKLFTSVVTALRAFRHLTAIEAHRQEIRKIALASARFVPREFLKVLCKESIVEVELGDQVQQEMTIMFSDVRSFTSLSEGMTPKENFDFINELLSQICPVIRDHNGFVDKYLGDGIMALFPGQADDAVQAAIDMRRQLGRFNAECQAQGRPSIQIGIGLHTGLLMLGTIGEAQRMEGTVISDAVNLASRVEGLTKRYGAGLVISEQTLLRLEDPTQYHFRFVDRVQVKGKRDSVAVFEVFDGDENLLSLKLETKSDFEQGLFLYHQKQFPEASVYFNNVLKLNPNDEAARLYLRRAAHGMVHGVPEDWTGVEMLQDK